MAANLTALYAREPTPRLLKGIRSFVSGLESQHGEQRLHGFVRALDGVTKLPRGKSEREFVKRCQIFTGSTTRDQKLLSELYRLRSAGEHLNPFELELSQYLRTDWEAVAMRRTQQAEALARHVFVRILSSHEFVDRFSQDEWLDVLWAKSSAEIMEAWGEQVDLH